MAVVNLIPGKQALPYTGEAAIATITEKGLIRAKLWGGGGSGAHRTNAAWGGPGYGGAGGFSYVEILVEPGDVVRVETAGGGGMNATSPGFGGWPDGGRGGTEDDDNFGGSGGGSSRIWVNDVLVTVAAGGGGGASYYNASNPGNGGAGGGLEGQRGPAGRYGTGGTQTTGGVNVGRPADTVSAGSYLQGGAGYRTGVTAETIDGSNAGAGGGGGYYGGGGSMSQQTSLAGGAGGGSSYLGPKALNSYTLGGNLWTPPATDDPDYISGVAIGGLNAGSAGPLVTGGPGHVALEWGPGETITQIAPGAWITEPYSGSPSDFIVTAEGTLQFELWGGGGGGAQYSSAVMSPGGAGGFTEGFIAVYEGDIVRIETAGPTTPVTLTSAGLGGWPDGGNGGFYSSARKGGGGGGSTRLWINSVLVAVAGGGGGGGAGNTSNRPDQGGSGGGLEGGTPVRGSGVGGGGTQTAGGTASLVEKYGGYLRGGQGHDASSSWTVRNGTTAAPGSGGGGGYYGGGGGANIGASGSTAAAGGGSGFLLESVTGETLRSDTNIPLGTERSTYQPGVGVGSDGLNTTDYTTALPGGPGLAVFLLTSGGPQIPANYDVAELPVISLTQAPTATAQGAKSATAVVALPTITLSPPAARGVTPGAASGDFGPSITFDRPEASAAGGIGALFPIIYVSGDLGGQPQNDALVVTGIADDVPYPLAPVVVVEAAANPAAQIGSIKIEPMKFIYGNGYDLYDPLVLNVSPVPGEMSPADDWLAEIDSVIQVTTLDGSAKGDAAVKVPPGQQDWIAAIGVASPQGDMAGPDQSTGGDLGGPIQIGAVTGMGELPVLYTTAPYANDITLSMGDADGSGAANAVIRVGNQGQPFATIQVQRLQDVLVAVPASASRDLPLILVGNPLAAFTRSATVRVNYFDRIYLNPPSGFAAELTAAVVDGDLSDSIITITPPESLGAGGYAYDAELPRLYIQPVEGYVEDNDGISIPGDNGNRIRFKRALASGSAPDALEPLEIALNEHDGLLFTANPDGGVQASALGRFARGGVAPEGGQAGEVLYADGVWRAAQPAYERPVLLPPTGRRYLSARSLGASVSTPTAGKVIYQPFFLPRQTTFSRMGVSTDQPSSGSVRLGVCRWDVASQRPIDTVFSTAVGIAGTTGDKSVAVALTLEPGWYAAMIAATAPAPPLRTQRVPTGRDASLALVGDLSGADTGDLSMPPQPTGREAEAHAYIWVLI